MQNQIEITFLRHEHAQAEDEEVHEGCYDSLFINIGRGQIRQCAKGWQKAGFPFDRIIVSIIVCTSESAHIITENFNTPLETDPDWMEFNHGPQAGLRHQVAADQRPQPDFRNPYEPFWETGESDWEAYDQATRVVENRIRRGPGRYLGFAQGGILNDILRAAIGYGSSINATGIWFLFSDIGSARDTILKNINGIC